VIARGAFWIGVYLALVLAPLFVLLVGPSPPGLGFWWDLALALGFAGLAMMGVQFVLTARFRRATAPYGIDIIYYFHRYLGVVALVVVTAHPALLIYDNPAAAEYLNPFRAPGHMAAGLVSLSALVVLVAASLWRKTLQIPYEPWRVTHALLAVTAVGLALVHIEGVQYYVASPWERALWRLFAFTWIAVLAFVRLVRPWQLMQHPYRVTDVVPERGDAWTLRLAPSGHPGFSFSPGQFVWLTLGGNPFLMREHPFSISSSPSLDGGRLEVTVKELGDFTRAIGRVRAGEAAYVDGPYGAFTIDRHPAECYVFIAGGIGIAPILSMLRALADRGDRRPLMLFYAYRRWDRVTCREQIEALRSRLALEVVFVLEEPPDGWTGERGRITHELLDRRLPRSRRAAQYFLCGPEAMTQSMERLLHRLGVPRSRVQSELFDLV
jgi:predicted ferric reductase